MVQVGEIQFATSIGVLFTLKETYGCNTLQETFNLFEKAGIDIMIDILKVAYNKQNKKNLSTDDFIDLMGENNISFMQLADIFQQVVEKIMFDGMSAEAVAERKKFLANQMK